MWSAKLQQHKTVKKGKERYLEFGPRAQSTSSRYLDRVPTPPSDAPIFLAEARDGRDRARAACESQTPLYDSHVARYEREAAERDAREFGDRYTEARPLRNAIKRAIAKANKARKRAGEKATPVEDGGRLPPTGPRRERVLQVQVDPR